MRFMMKAGEQQFLTMSVILFNNLISHLLFKIPKISTHKIILPILPMGAKSDILLGGKNINCKSLETRLGKYFDL
jgi:hypothetical protein